MPARKRVLLVTGPTFGLVFPFVPLAWSLLAAGHEVTLIGPANAAPAVTGAGLPFVGGEPRDITDLVRFDRAGRQLDFPHGEEEMLAFMGHGFGRLAAYSLGELTAFAERWRPDVVVGSTFHYGAPLLAARLGVPWVNHAVEVTSLPLMDLAATEELQPELSALGLSRLPEPDLFLDTCPPSLLDEDARGHQPVRYVPFSTSAAVQQWMVERGDRPRICLTLGSRITPGKQGGLETLQGLLATLGELDAEVLVAATDEMARLLDPLPPTVRAGWLPLDVVIPTCDAVVHHGGGNTMFSSLAAGVPQLVLPYMVNNRISARRLAQAGIAEVLAPGDDSAENVLASCQRLLAEAGPGKAARAVADEIAAMPSPAELADVVAGVARDGR